MKIPLHIKPHDNSEEADLARIAHYQSMFALTGGRGFRDSSDRIERMAAKHFSE